MNYLDYLKLLRVQQWYKNIMIFAVPIFSKQILFLDYRIILGFLSLCLLSSVNYIINDVVDKKNDKKNPEKKSRPIASGKIRVKTAIALAIILFIAAILTTLFTNLLHLVILFALFINTQLYSFVFKHEVYLDVILIAINFVIRSLSGYAFVTAPFSHWLIICTFFLALLIASGKRYSEFFFLKDKHKHRKVFLYYNADNLNYLLMIATICFIMSLSIFPFFSEFAQNLIFFLPLSVYLSLRYLYLVRSGSKIARHAHLFYRDKKLFMSMIIYVIGAFIVIYI